MEQQPPLKVGLTLGVRRPVIDAFFATIDGLPPHEAIIIRFTVLKGAFPSVVFPLNNQINIQEPPSETATSQVARRCAQKAVNSGHISEIFVVNAMAAYAVMIAKKHFAPTGLVTAPSLAALEQFSEWPNIVKGWGNNAAT